MVPPVLANALLPSAMSNFSSGESLSPALYSFQDSCLLRLGQDEFLPCGEIQSRSELYRSPARSGSWGWATAVATVFGLGAAAVFSTDGLSHPFSAASGASSETGIGLWLLGVSISVVSMVVGVVG